jgi:putative ABC transport system permease protein
MYRFEMTMGQVFSHFTILAIAIACMGLLGLTSYTIVWRTKEIGIRKVLGASTPSVAVLLMKEFAAKVLVSNIIAWPVAYYAMNRWLQEFAYRIDVSLLVFLFSAILALMIALFTVSFQVIKVALASPVNALRYE